ncbi:MAG: hypothetical protein M3N35_07270 [Candidatus Binatota bacterium]|nr:hypothetical protein [Candidatus Binatota bacterium]
MSRWSNASLTTRFALDSFLCIGLMTVALWFIVSNYLINSFLEHEWQATARMVRGAQRRHDRHRRHAVGWS